MSVTPVADVRHAPHNSGFSPYHRPPKPHMMPPMS